MPTSSDQSTIRQDVADLLEPLCPPEWQWADGIPTLGTLDRPLVWFEYTGFAPLPDTNPAAGAVAVNLDICIVTNLRDMRAGEDAADEQAAVLFQKLVSTRGFYDLSAEKSKWVDAYFGWRIHTTIHTTSQETT